MEEILNKLIREHELVGRDLDEIEVTVSEEEINYSNIVHCFNRIFALWDGHEKREESFFNKLKEKNYSIPYEKILFEHGVLRKQKEAILKAFSSGSEFEIKKILGTVGKGMGLLLREHMNREDEILYRIPAEILNENV